MTIAAEPVQGRLSGFFVLAALIAFATIGIAILAYDTPRLDWQHAARWTADWSSVLFLSIFVPQLRQILPEIDGRQRVLSFVAAHVIHAGTFIIYHLLSSAPNLMTMMLGGLGYVLIGALVLIFPRSAPRLHIFSIWYVWFIFIVTFASGIGDTERTFVAAIGVTAFIRAALARWHYNSVSKRPI